MKTAVAVAVVLLVPITAAGGVPMINYTFLGDPAPLVGCG